LIENERNEKIFLTHSFILFLKRNEMVIILNQYFSTITPSHNIKLQPSYHHPPPQSSSSSSSHLKINVIATKLMKDEK